MVQRERSKGDPRKAERDAPSMWVSERLTTNDVVHHGIDKLLCAKSTAFQTMAVADIGPYGRALVLDGRLQTTSGDEYLYHEPIVHVPCLLQGGAPKKVLILGGADAGAARVALQWKSVERVVVVDIDSEVVEACKEFLPEIHQNCHSDPRLQIVIENAMDYVERETELFDVVIADITDPLDYGPSYQLFTKEFFTKAKKRLASGGFFTVQAGTVSLVEEPTLHARVCNTVAAVFKNATSFVSFIPSYATPLGFCLATDGDLGSPADISSEEINQLLDNGVNGALRAMDGVFFRGLFSNIPKSVRQAVRSETVVFTSVGKKQAATKTKKKNTDKAKASNGHASLGSAPKNENAVQNTPVRKDETAASSMTPSLWVSRYPIQMERGELETKLREEFSKFGSIRSIEMFATFAFVVMDSWDEVQAAIDAWTQKSEASSGPFKDIQLVVKRRVANPSKLRSRTGYRSQGRGRGRGRIYGESRSDDPPSSAVTEATAPTSEGTSAGTEKTVDAATS